MTNEERNEEDAGLRVRNEKIHLSFNPIVTIISFFLVVLLVLLCIFLRKDVPPVLNDAEEWIKDSLTWVFIFPRTVAALALLAIFFTPKMSEHKMSPYDEDKPEFSTFAWFCMILMTGLGIELVYHSVSDPINHYTENNRYLTDNYMPDNTLAQNAINLLFFHWGFHMWSAFSLVGLTLAFIAHRQDLPLSFKTCFYPLLGRATFTWIGDVIDILAVCAASFSMITCLVFSAKFLNSGANFLVSKITRVDWVEKIFVWILVIPSAMLALVGIKYGIRSFSFLAICISSCLCVSVWLLDNTWFLSNLFVQSLGFHGNWFLQLGFHTDAFEQSVGSFGASERGQAVNDLESDGMSSWMSANTVTYWAMWMSWAPFVGGFLARISKGRTVREFISATLIAPVIFTFVWITVMGGGAISTERYAHRQNLCCDENWDTSAISAATTTDTALTTIIGNTYCSTGACNTCATSVIQKYVNKGYTDTKFLTNLRSTLTQGADGNRGNFEYIQNFIGPQNSNTGLNRDAVLLSCAPNFHRVFYSMSRLFDVGIFLKYFVFFTAMAFCISTLTGALYAVNMFTNNGSDEFSNIRIGFWTLVIGGCSTGVLCYSTISPEAMGTIQFLLGLPLTVTFCIILACLYRELKLASSEDLEASYKTWKIGYFDFCSAMEKKYILGWLKNIVLGPYHATEAFFSTQKEHNVAQVIVTTLFVYFVFLLTAMLPPLVILVSGIWVFGILAYLGFACILTIMRSHVRIHRGYHGNPIEDFFACLLNYPSVCQQMEAEIEKANARKTSTSSDNSSASIPKRTRTNRVQPNHQSEQQRPIRQPPVDQPEEPIIAPVPGAVPAPDQPRDRGRLIRPNGDSAWSNFN